MPPTKDWPEPKTNEVPRLGELNVVCGNRRGQGAPPLRSKYSALAARCRCPGAIGTPPPEPNPSQAHDAASLAIS